MNLAARLLRMAGWTVRISAPDYPKCIICVAPHTSNWDFIIGKLAYASVGRRAGFLMKEQWFFWPLGCLFRAIGGIPVPRGKRRGSLTEAVTAKFKTADRLQLAITPEGTRSRNADWHTGFLRIALAADVPVELGVIDYAYKTVTIADVFVPTGDIDADMSAVKRFYAGAHAKYPENFTTDPA